MHSLWARGVLARDGGIADHRGCEKLVEQDGRQD
jgi:hypothetical protein